jgi:hypothetical protein
VGGCEEEDEEGKFCEGWLYLETLHHESKVVNRLSKFLHKI